LKHQKWFVPAGIGFPVLIFGVLSATTQPTEAQGPPPPGGGPIQGLSQIELNRFNVGRNEFLQNENPQTGLGPVFNGNSCAQCHAAGGLGGASIGQGVSVVTRIGALVNGQYSDLAQFGGPLLQRRSLLEVIPNYPVPGEVIPVQAQFVARRITTPVFGMGLIESIPPETILSRSSISQGGGIMGHANMVVNPETGQTEVGRFGWKAQVSTAHLFAGDAYLNEMGITNPSFPAEVRPQGNNIPPGADPIPDPEVQNPPVDALTDFMRFSAPIQPLPPTERSQLGRKVFERIQCSTCHVPTMMTGNTPSPALRFKNVNLYSDLLLHDMGSGLADGIQQGDASGSQFRTAPLWGLRTRPILLHDGRATTIDRAIREHGGEAVRSRNLYQGLSRNDNLALIEFLSRL
jgi:CxxC motif-containing protein (DUF1111 family)